HAALCLLFAGLKGFGEPNIEDIGGDLVFNFVSTVAFSCAQLNATVEIEITARATQLVPAQPA
ncbi:MAG: hypothetical protein HYU75_21970, partial [Betaproteobacteria bacterium]|nr:hypothetical protein [Betaproteobacteria bacterium]